jgi:hypothetical protein
MYSLLSQELDVHGRAARRTPSVTHGDYAISVISLCAVTKKVSEAQCEPGHTYELAIPWLL